MKGHHVNYSRKTNSRLPQVVGIVPMAGRATRLTRLPCSKEIFPLDFTATPGAAGIQTHTVCEHVLDAMQHAGISEVYLVIRDGKWDIPAYLGDGSRHSLHLAYLMMGLPWGTPYSIGQAYSFVRERRVALGFPDMCFNNPHIFKRALDHHEASGADVVLGIFPADRPHKVDIVQIGDNHRVEEILIKPAETTLSQTWGIAVWTPIFTEFLHSFLDSHQHGAELAPELFVGDVFRAAIEADLNVQGIKVSTQPYVDIGTAEDLERVFGHEAKKKVNSPPAKAGGFGLRLKTGSVGHPFVTEK